MSDHSLNHSDNAKPANPVKTAIMIGVGALVVIIGIVMLANYAIGTHEMGATSAATNTPNAINKRITPAASFEVSSAASATPALATSSAAIATVTAIAAVPIVAMAAPTKSSSASAANGEGVYKGACIACHGAGIAGAPKAGDKAAWTPRIAQGKTTLYDHAIKGFQGKAGVMPAKGGNVSLIDADVQAAVDYMVSLAK